MVLTSSSDHVVALPSNLHARALPYGMINWATKGVFLGERHLYFVPQPDDVLSWGDRWDAETHSLKLNTGYRLAPEDLDNLVGWMNTFTSTVTNGADLKIEMPFNGHGSEPDRVGDFGPVRPGTLTAKAVELQDSFVWLNHTYTHANLDHANETVCTREILSDTETAAFLGFADYTTRTLLTGAYTGLENATLINAAFGLGVRYILANQSVTGYQNLTPNTGIRHSANADMLLVPRYANNIFYSTTTPEEQTDYYNNLYCPGKPMAYPGGPAYLIGQPSARFPIFSSHYFLLLQSSKYSLYYS